MRGNILDFVIKYWWWFFVPVFVLTSISAYFWYVSVFHYNPEAALEIMRWDYPPALVEAWTPRVYASTIGLMVVLTVVTFFPLPFLLYLRFFRFKRKGCAGAGV